MLPSRDIMQTLLASFLMFFSVYPSHLHARKLVLHLQIGLKLPAFLNLVMVFESACVLNHSLFEYLAGPSIVLTFESRMVDKL